MTTTYIGNYLEWTGTTGTMKRYYYAGAQRVAMRVGSGTGTTGLSWLIGDHLGSTSITADGDSGAKTAELRHKGWGEIRYTYGTTNTAYRYTGQRQESGLGGPEGLYYYNARWYDPYLNRWIQPDSIIPDTRDSIAYDRYAYSRNNPIRFSDPSGHSWWDTVAQLATGFVNEFALRNAGWISPNGQNDLGVNASETNANLVGRIAADVATIILGVDNVTTGVSLATGGTAVACGTTLCLGATATVAGGVTVAAIGASQVTQGAIGLGGNLTLLTGNTGSSSSSDDWNAKKPYGGVVKNPDGTTIEYAVRKSVGSDGGWSRTIIIRDENGNVISVTHEAWSGSLDPRVDPPDHTDVKPVNRK